VDTNGNLVLVGDTTGEIKLPSLRLDDVVTVFRSVYLDGEGPTVTIDPAPENPEKSAMIIKHSKATDGTYVGWVLYQADRLMKGYMLGVDNKTQKDMVSGVQGYREVVDSIYFGTEDPRKSQKAGNWERFWIVPAEANRFEGTRRELTLLDVPLKVKTQKMIWVKDKLEDDLTGKSSSGALAFTSWFTKNYDGIAGEQCLQPPAETGLTAPVPVFTELRQIALMTAIAEKLRDQGVPMPFWMRDYEVQKVPFETTTPALEVTRKQANGDVVRTSRIFGGVEMSPESKDVKTFATAAEVAKAPPEVRAEVDRSVKLAGRLEEAVAAALPPVGAVPLAVRKVKDEKHAYQAVSLPGATSQALGPCRLQEADLVVSFAGGREIRLARLFNSFFNPKGPWGKGWTMDLPRLQKIRIPGSREGSHVTYTTGYELFTPLNSSYARFKEIRPVQELGGSKLQVPDAECPFYGLANTKLDCLKDSKTKQAIETVVLRLKDGGEWYFSPEGDFIAAKEGPQMTVYERGTDGQVSRIIGLLEDAIFATINLEYRKGILVKAVGVSLEDRKAKAAEVSYAYDPSGRLEGVGFEDGKTGYSYQGSWVSSVSWTDKKEGAAPKILNAFEYNERGQVLSEQRGEQTTRHEIAAVPGGIETSVARTAKGTARVFARYDTQMRPVEDQTADGTHTAWNHQPDGSVETTVTMPDKRKVTIVDRKLSEAKSDKRKTAATGGTARWQQTVMILDRKLPDTKSDKGKTAATDDAACWQRTVMTKGGPTMESRFDAGGNLTRFTENQWVLLTQQWRKDGQLAKAATEDQEVSCQYGEHGLLSAVSVRPPKADAKPSEWQNTKVDRRGAPTAIEDGTGLDLQFGYDASGALASAVQKTPDGFLGFNVERDPDGRVRIVKSSWGDTSYNYAKGGGLTRVESTRGGRSATVELNDGLVRKVTGVDGGVTTFDYHDKGNLAGAPRGVQCANGLKLAHEYTADERLKAVAVGTTRRVRLGYDAKGRVNEYAWEPLAGGTQ
jgi:YD repeat-containing protein